MHNLTLKLAHTKIKLEQAETALMVARKKEDMLIITGAFIVAVVLPGIIVLAS